MALDFVTNQEIIMAARRNLTQQRLALPDRRRRVRNHHVPQSLRPRQSRFSPARARLTYPRSMLRQLFSDTNSAIPVMLAPIGSLQSITPEGGVAVARAAEEFGTVNFVSSVTQPSLEEIAAASRNPKIFQLYVQGDLKWVENLLTRVKRAGYSALCLTVDTAHYGHRERQMMDRWLPPSRRGTGYEYRAGLTWETLDAIKQMAGLPFILKGVATAEDAALAVDHGVSTIYVSNHGGRQLDHGRATIDMLPEIVDAVRRPSRNRARWRHRPRQRRAQGHRPGSACRRHRQTSRLGTRRRRSSGFNTGSRNT